MWGSTATQDINNLLINFPYEKNIIQTAIMNELRKYISIFLDFSVAQPTHRPWYNQFKNALLVE